MRATANNIFPLGMYDWAKMPNPLTVDLSTLKAKAIW
jgi:hypothetical protein